MSKLIEQQRKAYADIEKAVERDRQIVELAREKHEGDGADGDIEFDEEATVSEGDGNGAYVQAWVWVSFADTPLDKEKDL